MAVFILLMIWQAAVQNNDLLKKYQEMRPVMENLENNVCANAKHSQACYLQL